MSPESRNSMISAVSRWVYDSYKFVLFKAELGYNYLTVVCIYDKSPENTAESAVLLGITGKQSRIRQNKFRNIPAYEQ